MRPTFTTWRCNAVFLAAAIISAAGTNTIAGEDSLVAVRVIDEHGEVIPARAWVECNGMRLFKPTSPDTVTPYNQDRSFSCDGLFFMQVPEGSVKVHVEKGKEYLPFDVDLEMKSDETMELTVRLSRWIDMPAKDWYSADMHVHLGQDNLRVLKQLALADDVHLVPAFTYWLRGKGEAWHSQWPSGMELGGIAVDDTHAITRNNIEIERITRGAESGSTIGATFLFNLQQPVTAEINGEHFPTDADLCRLAQTHSPRVVFDSDKPSWAETVVGAALGTLDTIQVCHNHFHRYSTIPGGYGMIGPLAAGESNMAVGDGLFHRTNSLYYRLLNCGFRLGVSGGSAIGVMPVPTGHHRVYTRIDGPMTADKMWHAIKSGRSFATTGPMLTMTANGEDIGSTLAFNDNGAAVIHVATNVQSIQRLEAIEIVHNGLVIASRDLSTVNASPTLNEELTIDVKTVRSGWVAARALFRAPDGYLRQAHTSPIYIAIGGKPIAFSEDAQYMLRWLAVLEEIARSRPERFPNPAAQSQVLATYAEARTRYEQILAAAITHWRD